MLLVCLLCCFAGSAAFAQQSLFRQGHFVGPGALLINGAPVSCGRTPALISEYYPDYGAARPGLIILNPRRLQPLPPAARVLIYYHECAHQYVGRNELAADCWAVQKARRDGRLSLAGLREACRFISKLPANKHHPPGVLRCRHMARCYNDTYLRRASSEPREKNPANPVARARGFSGGPVSAEGEPVEPDLMP
jgi:hypothetical protein